MLNFWDIFHFPEKVQCDRVVTPSYRYVQEHQRACFWGSEMKQKGFAKGYVSFSHKLRLQCFSVGKYVFFFIENFSMYLFISKFKGFLLLSQPEKTANILRHRHWFPCEMTPEEPAQKFHTDDVLLSIEGNFQPIRSTTQIRILTRHQYRISAMVSQSHFAENQQLCCKMSDVFPSDTLVCIRLN